MSSTIPEARAYCHAERRGNGLRLALGGEWTTDQASVLDRSLRDVDLRGAREMEIDGSAIGRLDSAGAWLLIRTKRSAESSGTRVTGFRYPPSYAPLVEALEREHDMKAVVLRKHQPLVDLLDRVGHGTVHVLDQGYGMLGFLGRITVEASEAFIRPDRELPWPAFINQIEETGVTALPILGLLSFLLGVVLAYQGADQLRRFGADVFTVNLVGISILREVGCLITAIIVAGRSGSAFTAQIGTMKLNQEIDAMEAIGLNPIEILVLPRLLGLVIAMPFLTLYANIMGLIGGAVMCYFDLGLTVPAFMRQLHDAVTYNAWTFWLGLIKAPVFAFLIALVGCFEGMRVEGNAGSVGRLTTRSVVESIFLVIIFDAGFSIMFSLLGI